MENIIFYSPIILLILIFFIQYRIFVTPEQLEKKHREIIENVEIRFATSQSVDDLKLQVYDMKEKIDKIYDLIIETHR